MELTDISVNEQSSICIASRLTIRFDPFRLHAAPHDADIVFITHPHFDHFSPEDIARIMRLDTVFVAPESMAANLTEAEIPEDRLILMKPGESRSIRGIPTEAVASYNTDKPMHPRENGWLGYVITVDDRRIYVTGDSDLTPEAANVKCDILLLPIGGTYTMNAEEAAELTNRIAPAAVIPTHYGTVVGSAQDAERFAAGITGGTEVVLRLGVPGSGAEKPERQRSVRRF